MDSQMAYLSEGLAAVIDCDGPAEEGGEEKADREEGGNASSESWWSTAAVRLAISVRSSMNSLVVVTVNPNPPSAALQARDRGRTGRATNVRARDEGRGNAMIVEV